MPVSSAMACCTAPTKVPKGVKKGRPPTVQVRSKSAPGNKPCVAKSATTRACRPSGVDSVEKRKLKSTTTVPGMTLLAPVPPWMLLICQLVGGKYALPWSQTSAASAAKAGAAMWMGFLASCG